MDQGMLTTAQSPDRGSYNGTVDVSGEMVDVQNGVAEVRGKQFFVSQDGNMVADSQGRLVGFIENGVFSKNTNEHLKMLLEKGLIMEGGK